MIMDKYKKLDKLHSLSDSESLFSSPETSVSGWYKLKPLFIMIHSSCSKYTTTTALVEYDKQTLHWPLLNLIYSPAVVIANIMIYSYH